MHDVVEAPNGDLLVTGLFSGEFDFDPGNGVVELTAGKCQPSYWAS